MNCSWQPGEAEAVMRDSSRGNNRLQSLMYDMLLTEITPYNVNVEPEDWELLQLSAVTACLKRGIYSINILLQDTKCRKVVFNSIHTADIL